MWITKCKIIKNLFNINKVSRAYCSSTSSRKPAYYQGISSDPLTYRTLGQEFERSVEKNYDKEAFVACSENKRITYGETLYQADLLASKLLNLDLKPGDHIGLWAPNTVQWFITFLAAARANLVIACINPALQANEIKYSLNKAKCKVVLAQDEYKTQKYYDILKNIIPELETHNSTKELNSKNLPHLKSVIIDTNKELNGIIKFNDLLKDPIDEDIQNIKKISNMAEPDSPLNIQFTSGTTGQPKAALLTNFNFVNSALIYGKRIGIADNTKYHHRLLLLAPLFHAFGLTNFMGSVMYGATLVIPSPTYNPVESIRMIEKEKCTTFLGTPTMLIDGLVAKNQHNFDTSTLKTVATGGSTCTPQLYKDIKSVFNLEHLNIVYGLSEATAADFASYGGEDETLLENTVGKIYDHLEAKVINEDGKTVNFGESGELCMRGFAIMKEYFDDEIKTKEIISNDGWLKTGDQFILYDNGYGTIVGRKKDMIIRGGENIYPKEIEDFMDTHPNVLESQVVGVSDKRLGEEICLFLRMKPDCPNLTIDDVREFCKGNIAHFKIPKYLKILKEFPKTTSGKIQKFKLKEMTKEWEK
ncbi:medium-chain acyl-CoA ligase ACSF2, mitochondrial [Condylostylus longicornis]|uniref:medium-chain acyl-CoA ligase ACSF2, mitochondrial n=1 Tax=Condylostylus longicornis TaxID=2530218 RepID=UPI00244E22A1|nr:medium-chain acyl-CoA ligase ACSF2, mitochondrial [Condylostylus longicornis]